MSKHTATATLTTRLLEHAAMVGPIIHGRDLPGFGKHRANTNDAQIEAAA